MLGGPEGWGAGWDIPRTLPAENPRKSAKPQSYGKGWEMAFSRAQVIEETTDRPGHCAEGPVGLWAYKARLGRNFHPEVPVCWE